MLPLYKFLKALLAHLHPFRTADDAYLCDSVDLCDLERRMRVLDDERRASLSGISFGLYPR